MRNYHTHRMAVNFAISLITNIKNAKMLAKALIHKLPLDVSSLDFKSSARIALSCSARPNVATPQYFQIFASIAPAQASHQAPISSL